MTGKKKINLGPLPEELDYSKYEETVTRWDRVIAVALAGLVLLVLLIYLFFSSSKPTSEIALVEQELVVPLTAESGTNTPEPSEAGVTEEPVTDESVTDAASAIEKPVQTVDTKDIVSSSDAPAGLTEVASDKLEAPAEEAVKPHAAFAEVTVLSPAITQAILSDELVDNGPGMPLANTLILPESGITRVMLFTEMQGLLGRTLYHDWYRNGERQARVKVPVNYKEQRSLSSKFINLQMTGDWQVKVVDGKGKAYIDAAFKVIRP